MLRTRFLLAMLAGCFLAMGSGIATAQDYNDWARQAVNQLKKVQKHQPAPQAQPTEDERGYDGTGQDPDKVPMSKDPPDITSEELGDTGSGGGSVLGHRNIPK